ncbi:MAG TPA: Imm52 family immunity protein [Aliidongia sp.]|nr:Imm52 family immunity protein [Aliidongia sp.]
MSFSYEKNYRVCAQWEGRPESPPGGAARIIRMLENLGRCRPGFDRWTELGFTRREAAVPFSTMPPQIGPMIRRLEIARMCDPEGRPIPELGYHLSAATAALGIHAALAAFIDYAPSPQKALPNRVDITLSYETEPERQSITVELLQASLLAVIDAWEPATGSVVPYGLSRLLPADGGPSRPPRFSAGWVTYLAPPFAPLITPPAATAAERMPDGGLLIWATRDRFDGENAAHVAAVAAVQAALRPLDDIAWPPENYLRRDPSSPVPEATR